MRTYSSDDLHSMVVQIGDTRLYKNITVVESTGDCPLPDYVCGVFDGEQSLPFVWIGEEDELQQECRDANVREVVEAPDWMTEDEMRTWVLSRPSILTEHFDEDWIRHHDEIALRQPPAWNSDEAAD